MSRTRAYIVLENIHKLILVVRLGDPGGREHKRAAGGEEFNFSRIEMYWV